MMGFAPVIIMMLLIMILLLIIIFGLDQVCTDLRKLANKDTVTIKEAPFHIDPEDYSVAYFVIGNENTQKNVQQTQRMHEFLALGYSIMRTTIVGNAVHYILTKWKDSD